MSNSDKTLHVERTTRSVIEKKLLTSLQEEGAAAILVSQKDLDLLIDALCFRKGPSAREMETSLRQLRKEAFNA